MSETAREPDVLTELRLVEMRLLALEKGAEVSKSNVEQIKDSLASINSRMARFETVLYIAAGLGAAGQVALKVMGS